MAYSPQITHYKMKKTKLSTKYEITDGNYKIFFTKHENGRITLEKEDGSRDFHFAQSKPNVVRNMALAMLESINID